MPEFAELFHPKTIIALAALLGALSVVFRTLRTVLVALRRADRVFKQVLGDPGDPEAGIPSIPSLNQRLAMVEEKLESWPPCKSEIERGRERPTG